MRPAPVRLSAALPLRAGSLRPAGRFSAVAPRGGRGLRAWGQRALLFRHPPRPLRPRRAIHARRRHPARRRRRHGVGPGRHRETLRPRPRLLGRALRRAERLFPRGADLPHRPLPGQGGDPEPAGAPLCQHRLRAGVEPRPHPACTSLLVGGHSPGRPRGLLRHHGHHPRCHAEPSDPDAGPGGHGVPLGTRRAPHPRREGASAAPGRTAHARPLPARTVHRRCAAGAGRRRLPRGDGRARDFAHGHLCQRRLRGPQSALARRAVPRQRRQGRGHALHGNPHPLQGSRPRPVPPAARAQRPRRRPPARQRARHPRATR